MEPCFSSRVAIYTADLGLATAVTLPEEENSAALVGDRRTVAIMHAVIHGVSRDQMMGRHKANHIQVAYAPNRTEAERALQVKAMMFHELGLQVHLCGTSRQAKVADSLLRPRWEASSRMILTTRSPLMFMFWSP
jgi:hypothetical protein